MGQLIVSRTPALRRGKPTEIPDNAAVVVMTPDGQRIVVKIVEIRHGGMVAVGIEAPKEFEIQRMENLRGCTKPKS